MTTRWLIWSGISRRSQTEPHGTLHLELLFWDSEEYPKAFCPRITEWTLSTVQNERIRSQCGIPSLHIEEGKPWAVKQLAQGYTASSDEVGKGSQKCVTSARRGLKNWHWRVHRNQRIQVHGGKGCFTKKCWSLFNQLSHSWEEASV